MPGSLITAAPIEFYDRIVAPSVEYYDLAVDSEPAQREAFPDANIRAPYEPDGQYHVVENVPIFCEHTTTAKDGRTLVFDYTNLKKVSDCCNRRIQTRGNYATMIIGHSPDPALVRAGKIKNPPCVGFAGPFRMGLLGFGTDQVWCILARLRFFLDAWEEAKKYPNRSPELWLMPSYEEMFLDPIALLGAETPRLDLGLLYSAMLHVQGQGSPVLVEKYSAAAAPSAASVFVPSHLSPTGGHHKNEHRTLEYQGEQPMASTDEIVQAVVQGLEALDWVQWVKGQMQSEQSPATMGSAPAPDVNAPPGGSAGAMPTAGGAAPPAAPAMGPESVAPPGGPPEPTGGAAPPMAAPETGPEGISPPGDEEGPEVDADANGIPDDDEPPPEMRSDAKKEKNQAGDDGNDDVITPTPGGMEGAGGGSLDDFLDALSALIEQFKGGGAAPAATGAPPAAAEEYAANGGGMKNGVACKPGAPKKENYSIGQLTKMIGTERKARVNLERRFKLGQLREQGYTINPDELFERMNYDRITDSEFNNQIKLIESVNGRAPLDAMVQTFDDGTENYAAGRPGAGSERAKATKEQSARAFKIAEAKAIAGEPADYGTILSQVKAGQI